MNVLFIASEADPLIKVGGLGDVSGSLPLALKQFCTGSPDAVNLDIRLALPYYGALKKQALNAEPVCEFPLPTSDTPIQAKVFQTQLNEIPLYLIDGDPILPEAPVYGKDFKADARKFIFFSLACLYLPEMLNWPVDILHANDWHTALAVHQLKLLQKENPSYQTVHSILSVHNLPFMGTGSEEGLKYFQIPYATNPRMPKWARSLPLPMGLNAAERIVAVSPSYAQEIMTPEYGCDLEDFLMTKKSRISGIINGIDPRVWNPQTDSRLQQRFNAQSLALRAVNKQALQREMGLPEDATIPLLAFIGRMDRQKGIDLAIEAIQNLDSKVWQMIFLGTGDSQLESTLSELQKKYPRQVCTALRFDADLSHRIYAGADMLLMPSRYEPCGLAQMIAMRYGCIPVARATGGLKDTIIDQTTRPEDATGFLFSGNDGEKMAAMLNIALTLYQQKVKWQKLQENAMKTDFSWQNSAKEYFRIYQELVI